MLIVSLLDSDRFYPPRDSHISQPPDSCHHTERHNVAWAMIFQSEAHEQQIGNPNIWWASSELTGSYDFLPFRPDAEVTDGFHVALLSSTFIIKILFKKSQFYYLDRFVLIFLISDHKQDLLKNFKGLSKLGHSTNKHMRMFLLSVVVGGHETCTQTLLFSSWAFIILCF